MCQWFSICFCDNMVGNNIVAEHLVDTFFASIVWNSGSALFSPIIQLMVESEP